MKKILSVLFASLLVLGACGNQGETEKASEKKPSKSTVENKKEKKEDKKTEKTEEKQENKTSEETQTSSAPRNSTEENTTINNNQQPATVDNGNQTQSGQQVVKQQAPSNNINQNNQPKDPSDPSYQEYLNAKQLTENIQNNPDGYQHMGGGPGMTLSHPGQSFERYKQDVNYMRSQSQTMQH